MIALISGIWLLGLVLLIGYTDITYPDWKQRMALASMLLIVIASWIPSGLDIDFQVFLSVCAIRLNL